MCKGTIVNRKNIIIMKAFMCDGLLNSVFVKQKDNNRYQGNGKQDGNNGTNYDPGASVIILGVSIVNAVISGGCIFDDVCSCPG